MSANVMPTIYAERCTACGACLSVCPHQVLALAEERVMLSHPENCTYCGLCEEVCPAEVIELSYEIIDPSLSDKENVP